MSLVVHRRGYRRKGYTINRGGKVIKIKETWVKPSTYTIPDRGKPGRGQKVIPPLRKGALGGSGFFDLSKKEQEKIVFERARKVGEKKVIGELRALQVFFKRTQPKKAQRAKELSKLVAGSFKGKQYVGYPQGFSKSNG
jgi:hypothetical protein